MIAVEAEVVIPKAAAVPAEALAQPASSDLPAKPLPAQLPGPAPSATWFVVAFVLLAAAILFEMR
jgi:hypothetical protein